MLKLMLMVLISMLKRRLLMLIMDVVVLNTILRVITRRYPILKSIRVGDGPVSGMCWQRWSERGHWHTEIIPLDLSKEIHLVRLIGCIPWRRARVSSLER